MVFFHYFTVFFSASTACIFLCKTLRIILSLSLIFQPVFSYSAPKYVPICIDSKFNLATGTFGPPDPSLCGKGRRLGEGTGKADGPGAGTGGEGTNNNNNGRTGSPSSPIDPYPSPMDQSLGEWSREQDERARWTSQIIKEMEYHRLAHIQRIFKQTIKEAEINITADILKQLKRNFFSVTIIDEQWLKKIDEHSRKIHRAVKHLMYERLSHLLPTELTALLDRPIREITESIKIEVYLEIADFMIKTLTKEKMKELGKLFLKSNRHSNWIRETERIIDKANIFIHNRIKPVKSGVR